MTEMVTDTLPDNIETLKAQLLAARKEIHSLHQLVSAYQEEKRLAQALRFGASSEKGHP